MSNQHRLIKVSLTADRQVDATKWCNDVARAGNTLKSLTAMDPPFLVAWTMVSPVSGYERKIAHKALNDYLKAQVEERSRGSSDEDVFYNVCFKQEDWLWGIIDCKLFGVEDLVNDNALDSR